MICSRKSALLLLLLGVISCAQAAAEDDFLAVIRGKAATLPVLEASTEAGSPKFTVMRFNASPIIAGGERFGAVRVVCPPGKPLSLAWLFADTTNIDEYGLLSLVGLRLENDATRFIHPATASADIEQELAGQHASSLPRPWDIFQIHILGTPAHLLQPGGEYVIWFRFSDHRPTDMLLAATFLDPGAKLEPVDLPAIYGLPLLSPP